ncbi:MAG: N-formylglutamate amidohydrolase [Anderseniella sp.]|jgi:N-formylglutamate amidohydrolase|nr:N-formylglutamate amidohydrolase [Anderseniella sp.]
MTRPDSPDFPDKGYRIDRPGMQTAPVVFNSPHSGDRYPASFQAQSRLDLHNLRRSEDCFVGELFAAASSLGAPLMQASFPRAWLDVNREPWELDPNMFCEPLPAHVNTSSVRVAGGLGTIPRIVSEGEDIYRDKLTWDDANFRVSNYYLPYHDNLRQLVGDTWRRFGTAILVDCHSMPSAAGLAGSGRPDIVLGDRHGTSCAAWITQHLEDSLCSHGLKVSRNRPYAGGYITQKYGRPREGVHAVQIEINRMLYMNEATLKRTRGFSRLQTLLIDVMSKFITRASEAARPRSIAAE